MVQRLVFIILFSFASQLQAAGEKTDKAGTTPNFDASGSARLLSHFVDRGLSMTAGAPAMNAQLLLHMGSQFKLGFWGSNVSNLNSPEDNFWVRYVAEIKVDLNANLNLILYLHDNHYYKSEVRNGQNLGVIGQFGAFSGQLDFANNFEGTHTTSEYINIGYTHKFKDSLSAAGYAGYTRERADSINSYIDTKIVGIYQPLPNLKFEVGSTLTSDAGQLNERGKFNYYIAADFTF